MTGARIFVHPRCHEGVGLASLAACLDANGYDMTKIFVGPFDTHKPPRRELLRAIEVQPDFGAVFERMDGTRLVHYAGQPLPEPESA